MPLELQSLEPRLALAVADTIAPTVKSIAAPSAKTYAAGSTLSFKATFSETIIATGVPTLPITIGDTVRQATWDGKGSGGRSLVFTTRIQSGDLAPSGVSVAGPIGLSGATIRDKAGNTLIPAATGTFTKAKVDAVGPSVTAFGAETITPKLVSVPVTFSEPVTIKGKPSIPFTLAGVSKQLVYKSGSGKNVLTFTYKPAKGEAPTAANVNVPTQSIGLNGGAITDKVRNAAASLAKPTDVQLSATSIPENQPSGTVVSTLSAVDSDGSRDSHTFSLVSGAGSTDNASFQIVGNQLRTTGPFDFETKASYALRVRTTDAGGLFTEKAFTITVTNVDDVVVQFVRVGDAGNAADTSPAGYGAVGYEYRIGTYEVTIGQYTKFLNAVAKTDTYGLYNTFMGTDLNIAGISRSGSPGSYTYAVMNNGGDSSNRPITYVRWFDAARFANWMHNGQPMGAQNASTTEDGAYTLNGATEGTAPAKNAVVRFYIPTENEWYKAAYYKGGSTNAGYWDYATKSDSAPGNTIGSGANQANYYAGDFAVTQSESYSESQNYLTNVGAFTNSASYYGTFDQSGNVYEWSDLDGTAGSSRGLRGGYWGDFNAFSLSSSSRGATGPSSEGGSIGFRLASPV
jgi:formylglycine-generating enzyme required for sulfatase activity